jgi:homoserine O-acetyltransferase
MQIGGILASGCRRWFGGLAMMTIAVTATVAAHAENQVFSLYDFQFEDGTITPELRIAYETQGKLAPGRDNAILLLHETLRDHHAFDDMIGPGKVFDTNKYFVIAADAIGGGESSSPDEGTGQDFPRYTIRDVMAAEYGLVSSGLGLTQLHAIVGRSMGGLVLLAPSARSDANYQVIIDLMTSAIALDPDWNGGHYERNPVEGLRHAGMVYYPWSVSAAYLDRISAAQLGQKSEAIAKSFAAWDANSLVLRLAACREHDVATSVPGGLSAALARATMPILLMPSASDRLIDPANAERLRAGLPQVRYAEIPGDLGHRAIAPPSETPEAEFVERAIRGFLDK